MPSNHLGSCRRGDHRRCLRGSQGVISGQLAKGERERESEVDRAEVTAKSVSLRLVVA
jgi:hypothetical protein